MLKHLCPCCGRHCYLDETRCERGAEYAKTGVIPPRTQKPGGHHGDKHHSERKRQYRAMDRDSKLVWNIREMGHTIRMLEETEQSGLAEQGKLMYSEMFACLREEDRADLLMLLEKVRHNWHHRYGEKSGKHAHQDGGHSADRPPKE